MKVKMMTAQNEFDEGHGFHDLYINEKLIQGFFIPDNDEGVEEDVVSLLYPSMNMVTVLSTEELKTFLMEKFVL